MNAHTPVGVIPASRTVRRTIEVAVLETTLETVPQTESDAQTQIRVPLNQIIAGSFLVRQASWFQLRKGPSTSPINVLDPVAWYGVYTEVIGLGRRYELTDDWTSREGIRDELGNRALLRTAWPAAQTTA